MAITIGNVTTKDGEEDNEYSFNHDAGAGANRILVVISAIDADGENTNWITYNGVNLVRAVQENGANNVEIELWYLVNPAAGVNVVTVNISTGTEEDGAIAITLLGANTLDPLDAVGNDNGNSNHPNTNIITQDNNTMIIGGFVSDSQGAAVPDAGETERADFGYGGENQLVANSLLKAVAGADNMGSTMANDDWGAVAASFNELPVVPAGRSQGHIF